MNISIIQPHNLKAKGLRLRPGSVRASDQSLLIDLGSAKLLLNRSSAAELTSQLLDQLVQRRAVTPRLCTIDRPPKRAEWR